MTGRPGDRPQTMSPTVEALPAHPWRRADRRRPILVRIRSFLIVVIALIAIQGITAEMLATGQREGLGRGAPVPRDPAALRPHEPPRDPPAPMARVRELLLHVPARAPILVAFHEASTGRALRMRPLGRVLRNANRTKFDPPPRRPGSDYVVMSSRGRPHPATSAIDVALRRGRPVLAPVTGRVAHVRRYRLYGDHADYRIAIQPTAAPTLRVVIIHVDDVRIRRGDQVLGGVTVLGAPRAFPFRSQVNDYVGPGIPHVHLEVKARGT